MDNFPFRSFPHDISCSVHFIERLQKVDFLNYELFSNIYAAHTDFLNKMLMLLMKLHQAKR